VLGQRPGDDFQNHRRAFARGVVVLFHSVEDSLTGRKVDNPLSAHRVRNSSALSRVFSFRFHGQRVAAENIQVALGEGLLVKFSTFGGGRDRIEHACIGNSRFGVVGHELVSVCGDPYSRVARGGDHNPSRYAHLQLRCQ